MNPAAPVTRIFIRFWSTRKVGVLYTVELYIGVKALRFKSAAHHGSVTIARPSERENRDGRERGHERRFIYRRCR